MIKISNWNSGWGRIGLVLVTAAVAGAAFPRRVLAGPAQEQLLQAADYAAPVSVPLSSRFSQPRSAAYHNKFLAGSHMGFSTALTDNYKADNKYGDYYPFAGGQSDVSDGNGNRAYRGLRGGIASESGHPNPLHNGGDPKDYWERALENYKRREFAAAYENIGILCHLTQDQAAPVHAANINHVITLGDVLERVAVTLNTVDDVVVGGVENVAVPKLRPYEYYQALQDDTRRHLAGWVNPRTGIPYWPPAPDAPPLGKDATKGSWSHYPGGKDTYDKDVSPEIAERQVLMAAVYTRAVLKSAASLLPAVIADLKAVKTDGRSPVEVSFKVYDNKRGKLKLTVERPLYGLVQVFEKDIVSDGTTVPNGVFKTFFAAPAAVLKGDDVVVVMAQDSDGNITKETQRIVYPAPVDEAQSR